MDVYIFVHKNLCFSKINILSSYKEKDLQISAGELRLNYLF